LSTFRWSSFGILARIESIGLVFDRASSSQNISVGIQMATRGEQASECVFDQPLHAMNGSTDNGADFISCSIFACFQDGIKNNRLDELPHSSHQGTAPKNLMFSVSLQFIFFLLTLCMLVQLFHSRLLFDANRIQNKPIIWRAMWILNAKRTMTPCEMSKLCDLTYTQPISKSLEPNETNNNPVLIIWSYLSE